MVAISIDADRPPIVTGHQDTFGHLLLLPAGGVTDRGTRVSPFRTAGVRQDLLLWPTATGQSTRQRHGGAHHLEKVTARSGMEQFWSMIRELLLDQGSELVGIGEFIQAAPERLSLGGVFLCFFYR